MVDCLSCLEGVAGWVAPDVEVCSAGLSLVGGQGGSLLAYQLQVNQTLAEGSAPSLPHTRLLTSGGKFQFKILYITAAQTEDFKQKE